MSSTLALQLAYGLSPAMASVLERLMVQNTVTSGELEASDVTTNAGVTIHKLRSRLEGTGIEIKSQRSIGYWLDPDTKDAIRATSSKFEVSGPDENKNAEADEAGSPPPKTPDEARAPGVIVGAPGATPQPLPKSKPMGFFKQAEGEAAILVENGVYKQVDLYTRDGYLFAKVGGGFVRLMADGSTSKARLRLDTLTWSGDLARDTFGKLCSPEVPGARQIGKPEAQKLLGNLVE